MSLERTNEIDVFEALWSIKPNAEFTIGTTYASLNWISKDQTKPTEAEFDTALASVKLNYISLEYARNRAAEYPSQGDQNDMIYKDTKNSTTTHADAVEVVKTKWPKDNSGPIE